MFSLKLAALFTFICIIHSALSCRCARPDVMRSYYLGLEKVYSNCRMKTPFCVVASSASFATCGYKNLEMNKRYVLPLKRKGYSVLSPCSYSANIETIPSGALSFLSKRDCGCPGPPYIAPCAGPPCSRSSPPCSQAVTCRNHVCGGCSAQWFDVNKLPACGNLRNY